MSETDFVEPALELARETMRGQLRDLVLDEMIHGRRNTLPWNMWPESDQQALIERVDLSVGNAITRAVQILAADGKRAIVANIEQMVVKDGIKIIAKASRTENNMLLIGNSVAEAVLITFAEDAPYMGGQERKPEPLQQDLGLGEDGEGGPDGGGPSDDSGPVFDNTPSGGTPKKPKK